MMDTSADHRRPGLRAQRTAHVRIAFLVLLAGAALLFLLRGGDPYTVHAEFENAGQLVTGGSVRVAGRRIGTVGDIELTPTGLASVELRIDDKDFVPLRRGTRAAIRTLGQAGVANRRVELSPGPATAGALPDGAILPPEQTSGIVDLDAVLQSFGPRQRRNLDGLIENSAKIYAGSSARVFNHMLAKLDPAVGELRGLAADLNGDREALTTFVSTAGQAADAISSRDRELRSGVVHLARALGTVAAERRALGGILRTAPGTLQQAQHTLVEADAAVRALRPALRDVPAAARPLDGLLTRMTRMLPVARPVVADLRAQLPALATAFKRLPPLERVAVPGLRAAARTLVAVRPIVRAARFYGTDLVLGVFNGMLGIGASNYDRWGHYIRANFVQPPQTLLAGRTAPLLSSKPLVPGLFELRTGLTRRCPGGNTAPAPDGSSPWVPDASLCTPSQSTPAYVNEPPGRRP